MNLTNLPLSPKKLIAIGIVITLLISVFGIYGKFNGIHNKAVDMETQLSQMHRDNQNVLSTFVVSIKEQSQIAHVKSDKLDQILKDAVSGRYDGDSRAQPLASNPALISAVVEAYPDLAGLNIFDKLFDAIASGRAEFKNRQSALLDRIRAYDRWRKSGIIDSKLISLYGVPTSNLEVRIGNEVKTGEEALNEMRRLVLAADATEQFRTGELEQLDLSGK